MFEKWKYEVHIFEKTGGKQNLFVDLGCIKINRKNNETFFRLKKKKKNIPFPDMSKAFPPENKKRLRLYYYSPNPHEFYQLGLGDSIDELKPSVDMDNLNTLSLENKMATKRWKKQSNWQNLLVWLPAIIVVIVSVIMLVFYMRALTDFQEPLLTALQQNAQWYEVMAKNQEILVNLTRNLTTGA